MARTTGKKAERSKQPNQVFRIGFVSASVFTREIETDAGPIVVHSVNVQKHHRDGDDVKYTSSFNLADLPKAIRVLQLAQKYVEQGEADQAKTKMMSS